jgi:hypothetical protein
MVMAVLTCGCAQMLGIEDLPPLPPVDAGSSDFAVRGTAIGVLGPVALELRLGSEVELLAVTQEGQFAFETPLADGASYTVMLVNRDVPCTLRNETGVITGADTTIELTCTGASLASVVVSGIAPVVALVPGTTEYVIDLPLSQPSVTVAATVATPGDTLTIAGTPVASGTPSSEIPLNLGDNLVDVVVEDNLGWRRTYRLTLRRAAQLMQYAYGKASNTSASDEFGWSVALSGDTLAVGAHFEDSAATGSGGNQADESASSSGAVYVFRRNGMIWQQEAYLKASNNNAHDEFGWSVALSENMLAVGAVYEESAAMGINGDQTDNSAPSSGAVYVFQRNGTTWQQEAYLKASNTDAYDHFGWDVALSGDTLAVSAVGEASASTGSNGGNQADDNAAYAGAVYVFHRTGTGWQQEGYLKAFNPDAFDYFGYDIALLGDTLAVGAHQEGSAATGVGGNQADNSASASGAVYVFRRTGTAWQEEAYIKASNTDAGDNFGRSVALSGDTLAVGASGESSAATGVGGSQADNSALDSGAVYIFRRSGTAWQQEIYLKASNTGAGDYFGSSLALSGETLAVGALGESSVATGVGGSQADNSASESGAVYVFRRSGTAWQQESYLKASNTGAGDYFGANIDLSGDTLAIGALSEASAATGINGNQADNSATYSGAVYIFH